MRVLRQLRTALDQHSPGREHGDGDAIAWTDARVDGQRGPLSAQQSKAVLARLASHGEDTGIFERHLALEGEIAGSPLVVGNRISLLKDGPATYAAMFAAIGAARDHIHMETYII